MIGEQADVRPAGLRGILRCGGANSFRVARFIPAVDYINANRLRSRAISEWDKLFEAVDVIVTPTSVTGFPQLVATNLTGHPAVILPHGFRPDGAPVSLTFLGALYGEASLLTVAQAYQRSTAFHRARPPLYARVNCFPLLDLADGTLYV